jgi:translocation and assembly module TamB
MPGLRKIALRGLAGAAGLAIVAGLGLATPPGHWLVASAVGSLASSGAMKVAVSGISGWPPFNFGAEKITVSDGKGPAIEIDGLGIDLHAGALLTGRLVIEELLARRISIDHLPDSGVQSKGGGGAGLPPPIARIAIDRIELGPAIAGRDAALRLSGVVASGSKSVEARFDAERLDGATGKLSGTVARSADGGTLRADIAGEEGANGILAGLMGRTDAPAYRVTARLDGAGGGLQGAVDLVSDRNARFDARIAATPGADGTRHIVASGDGDLTALLPPDWTGLLGGPVKLALDMRWGKEGGTPRLDIAEARVSTGALTLSATGAYAGAATAMTVAVNAAAPDGTVLRLPASMGGASFAKLAVNGTAEPKGGATRVDLSGHLSRG